MQADLAATRGKGWFDRYRTFFRDQLTIDFARSPISIDEIEHMNLTRDDLIHNVDITTTNAVYQTKKHADRYPDGVFVDKSYAMLRIGGRIHIRRAELTRAMENVDAFCRWLEEIRNDYPAYRQAHP